MSRSLTIICCSCCLFGSTLGATAQEVPDPLCGANTLYVSLKALDADVGSFGELRQTLGEPGPQGYSLGQLAEAAQSYGMQTLGVETSAGNLSRRPGRFACIAHVGENHFVNIADVKDGMVSIVDPPRSYTLPGETLSARWDGTALLISPTELLAEEDLPGPFPWTQAAVGVLALLALYSAWVFLRGKRTMSKK